MLKRLRRIFAAVAILIALAVLVPLAYIEGGCRPTASAAASSLPGQALPAINEAGYRRKEENTFFTFPEWYIVYSFEDFGRFLDESSESHFNYASHNSGVLAQLLHHQPRRAANRRIAFRRQVDDLRDRCQLFRRIRYQRNL
jgi:hypothetical protein